MRSVEPEPIGGGMSAAQAFDESAPPPESAREAIAYLDLHASYEQALQDELHDVYEALEDAATYLRLAYTWIEDTDRHNKMKRAYERAAGVLAASKDDGAR